MKKGRLIILDQYEGRDCAALIDDGVLTDFLMDPLEDTRPRPGAIYRAKTLRPMKGQNGITLDLGAGQTGYLRQAKGVAPGQDMLVQVSSFAEGAKAAPVTPKLLFKSRYCIVTPDAPGLNIARKIRDEEERDRLLVLAHEALDGAERLGLIVRSVAGGVDDDAVFEDIAATRAAAEAVLAQASGAPGLVQAAETAAEVAWREWVDPDPDEVMQEPGGLELLGFDSAVADLATPNARLSGGAWMAVEPTSALVAVDVNTGADTSFAAGLKANLAAAKDLPRQLRLRGLGGQIVVDFAPMPRKDQRQVEQALRSGFKADGIETALVGWTGLGHFELQRKRERLPLKEVLNQ